MHNRKPLLIALILATSLTACSGTESSNAPVPDAYSREFQRAAADEMKCLPPDSKVVRLLLDCAKLRNEVRVR